MSRTAGQNFAHLKWKHFTRVPASLAQCTYYFSLTKGCDQQRPHVAQLSHYSSLHLAVPYTPHIVFNSNVNGIILFYDFWKTVKYTHEEVVLFYLYSILGPSQDKI